MNWKEFELFIWRAAVLGLLIAILVEINIIEGLLI